MPRSRAPYLDLIDADRAAAAGERRGASRSAPLAVKKGTPNRRELERDLGRHYEQCKKDNRGRFKGQRLKGYCAATAWTIVEGNASNGKGESMKRNSKGRFMKSTRRRPKSGSSPRRRRRARASEHNVRGYTMKRRGRTVRVRPHRSAEMASPRRRRSRARAPSRRRAQRRSQTNIIVARASRGRRRRYYAKAPPMATAGGLVIAGIGATVGYLVTDLGDRYIAGYNPTTTPAPTLPAGVTSIAQYNDVIVASKPGLARIGWGLGMMLVGFGGGAMAPWAGLKMFLYGWGLGATAHLGGQLLNAYVVEPMLQTNGVASANGSRMFQHEIHSNNIISPPAGAAPGTLTGLGQGPGAMTTSRGTPVAALGPGARGSLGAQPHARIPAALASRRGTVGQTVAPLNFSQAAYDQIAASQQGGFTYVPEGYVPPSPPATSTPPATPPSPPVMTTTPTPTPPANQPPGACGPCSLPNPCVCSGTAQCVCGNCPGPNISQMGQPPVDRRDNYKHPLFRAMNQSRSWARRAA